MTRTNRTSTSTSSILASLISIIGIGIITSTTTQAATITPATTNTIQNVPEILDVLWDATKGHSWKNTDGWYSEPSTFCDGSWSGIICYDTINEEDELYGHIQTLNLSDNKLVGDLPSAVFAIPHLQNLILRNNPDLKISFEGLEQAKSLKKLVLSRTHIESFDGIDASSSSSSLEELHITGCGYSGPFPSQITKLKSLKGFFSNYNHIKGPLPSSLGDMTSLTQFYMFANELTGPIPTTMTSLTNMQILVLANNRLSGSIPDELDTMTKLQVLSLADNELRGHLPSFDNLHSISEMYLQNNHLEGQVPADFLWTAPKMNEITVDLSNNELEGKFWGWRLKEFVYMNIYLTGNKFTEIGEGLCKRDGWMGGDVDNYKCDAVMCPAGTYSESGNGRQISDESFCRPCDDANVLGNEYMGASSCGNEQKKILVSFYNAMGGDNWYDNNWKEDNNECNWTGISCDDGGYVTAIELASFKLTGVPPYQIFALPELRVLDLSDNFIQFEFDGIDIAENLRELNLFKTGLNSLEDIDQIAACTDLRRLILSSNNIEEVIPDVIWGLTELVELAISHNNFYGGVSNDIANLQNLQIFHAYGNSLTGTIPASIYELRNSLRDLVLSENDFVGALPDGISNMHVLETLSLHQTTSKSGGLTGSLPDFAGCYALTTIHLGSNSITGELPEDFLLNSDYLDNAYIDVDLSSNYFEGKIPKSWSRIRLLNIDLSNNQIDHVSTTLCENDDWQNGFLGDKDSDCNYILCDKYSYNAQGRATASSPCLHCDSAQYFGATYCQNENTDNLAILEALFASTNGGTWKSSEGWFTSNDVCDKWYGIYCDDDGIDIVKIDLSDNDLSGTPSTAVYNLPKLRELSFARNPIDFSFDGIDAATKLEVLYLSQTRISSLDGIGKAKSLKKLHLTECYLSGPIPNELFNLVNLEGLFMNYNQFTGRIPTTIGQLVKLKKLFMMSNNLSGPIPAAIGKLSNLITLSLTDNAFSGSIPDEFNNLQSIEILAIEHERRNVASASSKNNRKLQYLQQSNRKLQQGFGLTGQLPSFNNLPNLKQLLLGYNSLTGSIPYNFLEGIKDKAEPLAIDLQYNLLEGTVPSSLTQFTNVQTALQGNKFTDVAPGLCSMTEWNDGAVKDLKCDAILCPKNTYSLIGRQTSDIECVQCPSFTASLYLGSVECISDDDQDEENERKILFEFYENLQGSSWTSDQYWYDEDVSFCKWYGITCAPGETDSVETIKLPSNGLEGHVPKAIFDLPNLQELHLGGNTIWISFDGIGKASKLQFLNLDATGLKTFAGIEASPSLKILHATMNELTTFPNEVLQLINLEVLYLSYNKFNMNLPNFSGLTKLGYFQCKECALTGVLPDWLGTMQSLRYLSLSHNILTGAIPSGLNELQLLEHLDLSEQTPRGGGLTGSVSDFKTLENLSSLYLNRNRLSGELNTSFLQKVDSYSIIVDLRYNELTGAIPDSFVDRFNELTLLLAENKISSIPNGCDESFDLEWNEGDIKEFGCDGLLCEPGFYSPIGRKTAGHRYNCVKCDSDSKNNNTDTFFGSTTCGIIPDKVALEAIYNSLGGPDWSDSELWMENDLICEWYGVICDDDERVIELELEDNNLQGDVPTEIYDLTELKTINLKKNKISFSFSGIEKLTHLDTLNLSDIGLNSVEDLRVATSLRVLHLTGNSLTVIPDDVYDLINLEELYMNYNKMEGEISSKIGQLTGLVELFMFRNKLSGNIPKEIGQLKQLRTLGLGENFFSGTLPPEMNGLENIEVIALQHARVSSQSGPGGPLSLDKGDVIGLSGSVPSFAESPRLTELYLGYNDFGGSIPESFLKNVSKNQNIIVDLTMNSISGSLPNSLRRFKFLTIYVAGNQIESLDEAFCDMNMWMGGDVEINGCDAILCPIGTSNKYGRQTSAGPICQACAFTFSAPYYGSGECMADLKNYNEKEILEKLYDATGGPGWSFANNWKDDSKSICEWHGIHCMSEETDGAAQVVKEISLPSNGLTGIIPPQVFDLQYLEVLNIRVNAVDIQLSSVIRNSVNALKAMYLDNTLISSLNGIGKFKNLRTLHLQQNNFVGSSLPEDLFTLTKMKRLYISDSNIGGELSSSIGGLASLEEFYSHNNEMTGEIPTEIGALGNLETLVLSENRFVGPLPDMTNMQSLQSLLIDSYTRRSAGLSGPLSSFNGMPNLREIYLNENSLTGSISHDFLGGISSSHERIKVGLKGNRIEGIVPKSLKHFQKLDIDLADNLITSIHPALCENDYWMGGYVETYQCSAILCPAGFYNQFGRQDNPLLPCKKCGGDEQSVYLGATKCQAEVKKREREVLEIFFNQCGGVGWKNKQNWLNHDVDICHWYGIQCNDEGSVDSILLGANNMAGKTPRELFELTNLKWLWLYSNPIDFSFHGIGEASSLTSLLLDSTGLTSLDGVGQAYQLVDLEVRFNRLSGSIPNELTHLVNLETLSLSDNDLTGAIPSFNRLHRLKSLRISNNKLSGALPNFASNGKLRTIDLSNNRITGPIPSNLLASLSVDEVVYVDLARNQIEGEIPPSLDRFDTMTLFLRDNFITGIHTDLCDAEFWNDGDVARFQCNAILCPPGTYAPGRGRQSQSSECIPCVKAKYYGQSECVLLEKSAAPSRGKLLWTVVVAISISIGMLV